MKIGTFLSALGMTLVNHGAEIFVGPASLSGTIDSCLLSLYPGHRDKFKLQPFTLFQGASGAEIDPKKQSCTWSFNYDAGEMSLFATNIKHPDYFYFLAAKPGSIMHSTLEIPEKDKFLMCAIQDGWVKYTAASSLNELKMEQYGKPEINLADAKCDISKTTVLLRSGDWCFPLFSKNGAFFDNDAVVVMPGENKVYLRSRLSSADQLSDILTMIEKRTVGLVVFAKPDSVLHEKFSAAAQYRSSVMRISLTQTDTVIDYFPSRTKDEYYFSRDKYGSFYYGCDAGKNQAVKLENFSSAPEKDNIFRAVKIDTKTGKITAEFSYDNESWTADIFATPKNQEKILVFAGKNTGFLKKYFPDLAGKDVLFAVENQMIRMSIPYSNGECRIPQMNEPFDWLASASVKPFFNGFLIRWGNMAFYVDGTSVKTAMASKGCCAVKVPCTMTVPPTAFCMTEKNCIKDMASDQNNYFLVLARNDGFFPSMLKVKPARKYVLAVRRKNQGWKLSWNDTMQIDLSPLFQ